MCPIPGSKIGELLLGPIGCGNPIVEERRRSSRLPLERPADTLAMEYLIIATVGCQMMPRGDQDGTRVVAKSDNSLFEGYLNSTISCPLCFVAAAKLLTQT